MHKVCRAKAETTKTKTHTSMEAFRNQKQIKASDIITANIHPFKQNRKHQQQEKEGEKHRKFKVKTSLREKVEWQQKAVKEQNSALLGS